MKKSKRIITFLVLSLVLTFSNYSIITKAEESAKANEKTNLETNILEDTRGPGPRHPFIYENLALDGIITMYFNEELQKDDKFNEITILDTNGKPIDTIVEIKGMDLLIKSKNPLEKATFYSVRVPSGSLKDIHGNSNDDTLNGFKFATIGAPKLSGPSLSSPFKTMDLPIDPTIILNFDETIVKSKYYENIKLLDNTNNAIDILIEIKDKSLIIKPKKSLQYNSKYMLIIPRESLEGLAGYTARVGTYELSTMAKPKDKAVLPETGSSINMNSLLLLGSIFTIVGVTSLKRENKDK